MQLSEEARLLESTVDWRAIGRFRNVIVHSYLALDLERAWDTIERDLEPLVAAVERIIRDE